jgi:hypothetical protein
VTQFILEKLAAIGIVGDDWFKSYFTDRRQFTDVNGYLSNMVSTNGVPQESVLGPILFLGKDKARPCIEGRALSLSK